MTTGLNFWDSQVWVFMMELGMLLGAMLFANMLRRLIPALRRSLIPSSVLAGFLVLIVNGLIEKVSGHSFFQRITLETLTYHCLGLGFVAYSLSIVFYIYAQRELGAAKTSAYYAVAPFIGAALSLAIFRESPSASFIAALVIMIAGTWVVTVADSNR